MSLGELSINDQLEKISNYHEGEKKKEKLI